MSWGCTESLPALEARSLRFKAPEGLWEVLPASLLLEAQAPRLVAVPLHCHVAFSVCLSLLFLLKMLVIGFQATLDPYSKMRLQSKSPGVNLDWTYPSGGHNSTHCSVQKLWSRSLCPIVTPSLHSCPSAAAADPW